MSTLGLVIFIAWLVEAPITLVITSMNVVDKFHLRRSLFEATEGVSVEEWDLAHVKLRQAAILWCVAFAFFLIGVLALAAIFGVIPSTGGVLISLVLVIAHGLVAYYAWGQLRDT